MALVVSVRSQFELVLMSYPVLAAIGLHWLTRYQQTSQVYPRRAPQQVWR
jgi:hypothetical protein